MHFKTVELLDQLLRNAIEENELETRFTAVLSDMPDGDREELVPKMVERAKLILNEKGIMIEPTGVPRYIANKLSSIGMETPLEFMTDEEWTDSVCHEFDYLIDEYMEDLEKDEEPMVDLVNRLIDNAIDECHLSKRFADRLRGLNDAGRREVCDMIVIRVLGDPDAQLPKAVRDPVFFEFDELLEARVEELK